MNLYKLLPEQVMQYWEDIRQCIKVALPPMVADNDAAILHIQEQLLLGSLECWMAEDNGICGVMTTQLVIDSVSRCLNMLIYTVAITSEHSEELWEMGAVHLRKYAIARQCTNIIAYSNNPQMIHIAERLGADSSYRLLTFKL